MKYRFLIFSLFFAITGSAQDVLSLMRLNLSNVLVEQAVDDGCFFLSHSYQLCDTVTMRKFGRYGSDIFGIKCGIAVKVKGGFVLPKSVISPWDYDENFTKYKDKYTPISYKIKKKSFSDSTVVCICNDAKITYRPLSGTDYCFIADTSSFKGDGFSPCMTEGNKKGWCIWYTTPNGIGNLDSLFTVSTLSLKYELEIKSDENKYNVEAPKTKDPVIGGIYVVPTSNSIGCLTFEIAGIMSCTDGQWNIVTPFFEFKSRDELSLVADDSSAPAEVLSDNKDETKVEKKQIK